MLIASIFWLGLAVLPWALGLSACVIYLGHSGSSVKKFDKNLEEEKAQDKSENTPLNLAACLTWGRGARQTISINEGGRHSQSQGTRPLLVSVRRPKCSRPVWKKTAVVFMCVLALAALAAVAPAVAVVSALPRSGGKLANQMKNVVEGVASPEVMELRLALAVAREEVEAARNEAEKIEATLAAACMQAGSIQVTSTFAKRKSGPFA